MTKLTLLQVIALSVLVSINYLSCAQIAIPPVIMAGSTNGVCPSESIREGPRSTLQQEVGTQLKIFTQNLQQTGVRHTKCMIDISRTRL